MRDRREYMREYQRQWVAARRAAWFADKSCVVCGATKDLEMHHIDPEEKVSNSVWSWAQARRDAELAKCEVRCAEHHMDVTKEQVREWNTTPLDEKKHGTQNTYGRFGCRCELCKNWRHEQHLLNYKPRVAQLAEQRPFKS